MLVRHTRCGYAFHEFILEFENPGEGTRQAAPRGETSRHAANDQGREDHLNFIGNLSDQLYSYRAIHSRLPHVPPREKEHPALSNAASQRSDDDPQIRDAATERALRYGRYCFCPELGFGHTGLANSIRHTGPS